MSHQQRITLAKKSLKGTSIGDAFGESFFGERSQILQHIEARTIPKTTWEFTDDTVMATAVFKQLEKHRTILQSDLVLQFSRNHNLDPNRGYGATVRRVLREVQEGGDWRVIAANVFDGMGSMGNGAAMRVCPIGSYFFDDLEKVKQEAAKSAEVTHSNIEAIAGAMAVAVGTAIATKSKLNETPLSAQSFITQILQELPDTDTKAKINKSLSIPRHYHIETVKTILGNGSRMLAQDTVPFVIWCAAHHLNDFEEAIWKAVSALGDRDTICAMVGGIVMMSSVEDKIPKTWLNRVEDIEGSEFFA